MLRFIGRRITQIILISFCIIFFIHLGMSMVPNSRASTPDYDVLQHGLRAWRSTRVFLSSRVPQLDKDALWQAYRNSMGLLLVALVGAAVVGLLAGGMAALSRRKRSVLLLLFLTILGISIPSFFAGLLLRMGELQFLATFGRRLVVMAGFGWDLEHMLMPVLVLAARPLAYVTRTSFLSLSQTMQEDYIRTAFSKGLGQSHTVMVHALRNIAVPMLTALGVSVRFSLSTLPVVELFFSWPGMGLRLLEAINARHTTMVVALACTLGLTFLVVNLLLDIAYRVIDPRIRES
jgi:peptide/nickel transport system permease protein